ncbi:FG-GAP-like repeat-containing protein [uncultured Arthrobacter sp.]|uniref:FG-GAP-like repeat-containing protein n=1 Tax=uncultured Arthrobacter sp. TaxID=114050 RepID=UPI00260A1248|nr:FG-GAP-like repeat-containing protein [uncultured Arthrobacter sp.]
MDEISPTSLNSSGTSRDLSRRPYDRAGSPAPPSLVRRTAITCLLMVSLILGMLGTSVPAAHAAPLFGHDVSWPQCSTAQGGFGLPLPPPESQFVIIGLTRGLAFTENPCLAAQVTWARTNAKPAHGYAMATYPTAAQLATYGGQGPWSAATQAGRLSNVGYSEARFAVQSLNRTGFRPPVVWIDVEPRPAQPWPAATLTQRLDNRYIIEGLMRGLRDAGFAYGFYSYTAGWQEIVGPWRLTGVPVWATAGRLDYPTEALDRCFQPSFSAGRVYISQWYDDVRDYDRTCEPYNFTPLRIPASTLTGSTAEFNGDWRNDILARVGATGALRLYAGNGAGRLNSGIQIGNGWGIFNALETVGDFNGDGPSDVIGRETATGVLWLYRGNGTGGWLPRLRVGHGWNGFSSIVAPGDFNGDQRVDLLARERATGALWLYPGNGSGGWLPRVRVGSGWNSMTAIVAPGDLNGDRTSDLLARDGAGILWLYPGNGSGGWLPRVRVGHGWNSMTAIMGVGDLNGDRIADIAARDASGALWLYAGNGRSGWLPRTALGSGWNGINAIF